MLEARRARPASAPPSVSDQDGGFAEEMGLLLDYRFNPFKRILNNGIGGALPRRW